MDPSLQIEPSEYDLVVIGTGLTEAIVAAAAATAGRSVLQLDPCDHYGGSWASLRLDELQRLLGAGAGQPREEKEEQQQAAAATAGVRGAHVLQRPGAELGPARQYSLDLAPKVAYGAGPLIQLLLGSGAHNYLEFKLVQGSYLLDAASSSSSDVPVLRSVPSSRSEVFKDRQLSPVQKRSLMRFLKAAAEALDGEGPLKDAFGEQPVLELLQQQGLDRQLQQSLLHGVLLADTCIRSSGSGAAEQGSCKRELEEHEQQQLSAAQALKRLRLFVQSAGRYGAGTGPFLTPLYGCGELPQAFSRVAAVAGAVQVLRCGIAGLSFDEHTFSCDGVELASGQVIRCQQLAANEAALEEWLTTFHPAAITRSTHRCCALLDGPVVPGEQHSMVALLQAAAPEGASSDLVVRALALCSSTAVCPPGKYVLYLWVDASGNNSSSSSQGQTAAEALLPALAALADTAGLQVEPAAGRDGSTGAAAGSATGAAETAAEEQAEGIEASAGRKSAVQWAGFWTHDSCQLLPPDQQAVSSGKWPSNVALCPGPDSTVTFASAVQAGKQAYWHLFPAATAAGKAADAAAGAGSAAVEAGVPFPLDPGQSRAEAGASEVAEASAAGGAGAGPGAGAAGAVADADSDDETLAALQAALQQVSGPATAKEEPDGAWQAQ